MRRHTTIRMHPDVLREAKAYAQTTRRSLTRLLEDAVKHLMKAEKTRRRRKVVLPVVGKASDQSLSVEEYQRLIDGIYDEEAERYARQER
jgi:hypothetical protein